MEGDNIPVIDQIIPTQFQSTPSAWRETFFYGAVIAFRAISIHSLRMEGDCFLFHTYLLSGIFQSTPSAWRETDLPCHRSLHPTHFNPLPPHGGRPSCRLLDNPQDIISIHSLRMEGDPRIPRIFRIIRHFNPLPPHGGRHPCRNTGCAGFHHFNPLPPHGGRLQRADKLREVYRISIHSLRMEGDT